MARPISIDPVEAVEKAMELFWEVGYHAASIDDIVRSTGLNRHTLYARFGNKFGLLMASLAQYREVVLGRIESILSGTGTPRDRIEGLLRLREPDPSGGDVWERMLSRGCFAIRVSAELRDAHAELARELDEFGERIELMVAEVVRRGQADGEFRADRTPEDLASVLVSGFLVPLIYSPAVPRTEAFLAVLD